MTKQNNASCLIRVKVLLGDEKSKQEHWECWGGGKARGFLSAAALVSRGAPLLYSKIPTTWCSTWMTLCADWLISGQNREVRDSGVNQQREKKDLR